MADTSSTTTFKADISALRSEMQAAARVVRVANSEFKAATAGMDDWGSSADGLEAKIKQLNDVLKAQNRQVELAAEELAKTEKEYGENSAAADRARIKYNNFKAAAAQTEKELQDYESQLDDVENATDEVDDATQKASDGFTVMKGVLSDLAASAIKAGIRGLKNLAVQTFKTGARFEAAMSQVEAVSGASAEEIEALTEKAKEMGSKTKFSASESAEAFNYMAMAGWKTQDMIDGIEGIMNLAAASGADLATTSDIVTDALTAMGYEAKDAGRLADVMAAASSNANTNVEMMGATFQYAAPLVGALGFNMEDTAVAIGMMANAGIKGEKAGTALRSILTRLSTGTGDAAEAMDALGISLTTVNDDGSVTMKSLDEVMRDLRTSFADLDETEQTQYASMLAGQEAMSGLLAIVNGSEDDFNNLTAAVANSDGAAASMAATMNDNVDGALTLLQSNVEGKMIGVFEEAAPSIKKAIDDISVALDGVDWNSVGAAVGDIAEGIGDFISWILDEDNGSTVAGILEGIAGTLGTMFVVDKVSTFKRDIDTIITSITDIGTKADGSKSLVSGLATLISDPKTWLVVGIAGVSAAIISLEEDYKDAMREAYGLSEAEESVISDAESLASQYENTAQKREKSFESIDDEYRYLEELAGEYGTLVDSNGNVIEGYEDRVAFIENTLANALGIEREDVQSVINKNSELGESIDALIEKKRAEALVMAGEEAYTEAIQKRGEAFETYNENLKINQEAEEQYATLMEQNGDVLNTYSDMLYNYPIAAKAYYLANREAIESTDAAYEALVESRKGVKEAETAYLGYISTIENYEGASAAVMSGDADAITLAVTKMEEGFISANIGTKDALEQQVKDFQAHYTELRDAMDKGMPGVTQSQVDAAKALVDAAVDELGKLPQETQKEIDKASEEITINQSDFSSAGEDIGEAVVQSVDEALVGFNSAGQMAAQDLASGIEDGSSDVTDAATSLGEDTAVCIETPLVGIGATAKSATDEFVEAVEDAAPEGAAAGQELGTQTSNGTELILVGIGASGQKAGSSYVEGVESKTGDAESAGKSLASSAKSGTSGADATQSGVNFSQGFINGIGSLVSAAAAKARELVQAAISAARAAQKEGSPSKLTYQSGKYFTQGYILGIVSEQNTLVKTVKDMVGAAVKELTKMSGYQFAEAGEKASAAFMEGIDKQANYMIGKIQYQNQGQIEEFDKEIERLQKERDKITDKLDAKSDKRIDALQKKKDKAKKKKTKAKYQRQINAERKRNQREIKATEDQYKKLIDTQEKYQSAYQKASSEMLGELQDALNAYQDAAQDLIDSTITGITDRYEDRYNNLVNKQDSLITKLKEAADLFEVSNAGVLMIGNIADQTQQIKDYTEKLRQIKEKVSDELFDQIARYDVKEGTAYMNYLLGLSASQLEAYNQAYSEKMKAATEAGEIIYGKDIQKVAEDYQTELETAFEGLPEQLEELGQQAMQGFINGLAKNTDYMSSEIQTFISGMIDTFKERLKINSPSKVTFDLGEYTGEGFVEGLTSLIKKAKSAAASLAGAVSSPLDGLTGDIGMLQGAVAPAAGSAGVVNNYNLVQNNNSPKSLSALETYQARRRQIALVKAFA